MSSRIPNNLHGGRLFQHNPLEAVNDVVLDRRAESAVDQGRPIERVSRNFYCSREWRLRRFRTHGRQQSVDVQARKRTRGLWSYTAYRQAAKSAAFDLMCTNLTCALRGVYRVFGESRMQRVVSL